MRIIRTFAREWLAVAVAFLLAMLLVFAPSAQAAPIAPNWLPGQPMMAGAQVIAMWLPVPGAVKYVIYLNGAKLMESPANQYIGVAPTEAGEYRMEISAVDASGAEGPRSAPGIIKIITIEPPNDVLLRPNSDTKTMQIRWPRPPGAAFFNIYRADAKGGPFSLLASVQTESYDDKDIEFDKTYYYKVTTKDVSGKESDRGAEAEAVVPKPLEAAVVKTIVLKTIPTKILQTIESFGDFPADSPVAVRMGPDGLYWVADKNALFHKIDPADGSYRGTLVVKPKDEFGTAPEVNDFDFDEDGNLWYCSVRGSSVVGVDPRGAIFAEFRLRWPTLEENKEARERVPDTNIRANTQKPIGIHAREEDILIGDTVGRFIVRLDKRTGASLEWIIRVPSADGSEKMEIDRIRMFIPLPDDTLLLNPPVTRSLWKVRRDDLGIIWIIGPGREANTGGFVAATGIAILPDGKRFMVTDATMHTIQVFDIETGDYLFNYGGPEAKKDPNFAPRPLTDFSAPFFPIPLKNGNILVHQGIKKNWQLRQPLATEPVALD